MLNQTIFGLGTHCAAVKKGAVHKRRPKLGGGKGSKIGQYCQRMVLKNCRNEGGGGGKNPEKLPTSFMDGPKGKRTAATNKGCKVLLTIPKAINTRS